MTALAKDRAGLSVNETAMEELKQIADSKAVETVKNRFTGRTETRTTYHLNGLDICTVVSDGEKIVEIQSGLIRHPVIDRLT
jgi:hypothetical protein